jgi:hypothetical protein
VVFDDEHLYAVHDAPAAETGPGSRSTKGTNGPSRRGAIDSGPPMCLRCFRQYERRALPGSRPCRYPRDP